jgi:hypothetical protein
VKGLEVKLLASDRVLHPRRLIILQESANPETAGLTAFARREMAKRRECAGTPAVDGLKHVERG